MWAIMLLDGEYMGPFRKACKMMTVGSQQLAYRTSNKDLHGLLALRVQGPK